jgi:hypothetical protein
MPKIRPLQPFSRSPSREQEHVRMTTHASRRIKARLGTGTNPQIIAQRAWEQKGQCPKHWDFPRFGGDRRSIFYVYGECVFVFKRDRDGSVHVITIFGPYKPNGTWWKDGAWERTD